jgi:hypothetical protein
VHNSILDDDEAKQVYEDVHESLDRLFSRFLTFPATNVTTTPLTPLPPSPAISFVQLWKTGMDRLTPLFVIALAALTFAMGIAHAAP